MIYLSKNLIYLRKQFNVSQAQLALQVDKRQSTIGNWENDQTYPDANDLIKINQFFGISIDFLLLVDLQKGNLITKEHVEEFKRNGNLIGNPIGKLKPKFEGIKSNGSHDLEDNLEQEKAKDWAVISLLKGIDEKIDQIRVSLGNKPENG
jgi:transcriptional regulator with XRE-family HTH domain